MSLVCGTRLKGSGDQNHATAVLPGVFRQDGVDGKF
jgi:hypothetical protein